MSADCIRFAMGRRARAGTGAGGCGELVAVVDAASGRRGPVAGASASQPGLESRHGRGWSAARLEVVPTHAGVHVGVQVGVPTRLAHPEAGPAKYKRLPRPESRHSRNKLSLVASTPLRGWRYTGRQNETSGTKSRVPCFTWKTVECKLTHCAK